MKKLIIVLVVVAISQLNLLAQQNENVAPLLVKGKIYEIVSNEKVALPFANVFIEGTDVVTTTDFDGTFILETEVGINNLKCTFRGYEVFEKEIDATNIKSMELEILMTPESNAMNNSPENSKI